MIANVNKTRLLFFMTLLLLLAAGCGVRGTSWAGVSAPTDEELYVSYGKFIAKLTPTGERLWVYPPADERRPDFYAEVTVDDNTVYVGDYRGG
ncbi:MAG TPA: hypothetical protein VJZ27_07140, partial [Aggregatilineales bacterium]|nr:hypothetical protein [Aggregatilineales bacterium]